MARFVDQEAFGVRYPDALVAAGVGERRGASRTRSRIAQIRFQRSGVMAWRPQRGEQERARFLPFPFDRAFGDAERRCHFFDVQPGEEPHFHDLRLTLVERFELAQCLVEGEQIVLCRLAGDGHIAEGSVWLARVALVGVSTPQVVDDDLAHRSGGERAEVLFVAQPAARRVDQLHVGFVNEGGRRKRLTRRQTRDLPPRQEAQFVVNRAEQVFDLGQAPRL